MDLIVRQCEKLVFIMFSPFVPSLGSFLSFCLFFLMTYCWFWWPPPPPFFFFYFIYPAVDWLHWGAAEREGWVACRRFMIHPHPLYPVKCLTAINLNSPPQEITPAIDLWTGLQVIFSHSTNITLSLTEEKSSFKRSQVSVNNWECYHP